MSAVIAAALSAQVVGVDIDGEKLAKAKQEGAASGRHPVNAELEIIGSVGNRHPHYPQLLAAVAAGTVKPEPLLEPSSQSARSTACSSG